MTTSAIGQAEGLRYLRAPRVITSASGGVLDDGVVVVDGGRITRVARAADISAELDSATVEHFSESTLLPGMVDAHAYLTLPPIAAPTSTWCWIPMR